MQIINVPSQGPFKLDQQVQFSCVIDPTPPDPVTYQWRRLTDLDVYGGNTYTQQSFNTTYYSHEIYQLPYCYYSCEVLMNQTVIGSTRKIIQLQGEIRLSRHHVTLGLAPNFFNLGLGFNTLASHS